MKNPANSPPQKSLALSRPDREFRFKPNPKRSKTIITGIICKDAIVLASDSQTTTDEGKRCKTKKLHSVAFRDSMCLVAESGNATLSGYFMELFRAAAADTTITGPRAVTETAE